MAHGGINKALVRMAREALLARGLHPSIDAVRVELGNTGSKSTIQRYFKELGEAELTPPDFSLSEELTPYISSVVERVKLEAEQTLAGERAAFERQQAAALHQRELEQAQLLHLQQAHAAISHERLKGLAQEQALAERLQVSDVKCHRLQEAHHQQDRLLDERAAQIHRVKAPHYAGRPDPLPGTAPGAM